MGCMTKKHRNITYIKQIKNQYWRPRCFKQEEWEAFTSILPRSKVPSVCKFCTPEYREEMYIDMKCDFYVRRKR